VEKKKSRCDGRESPAGLSRGGKPVEKKSRREKKKGSVSQVFNRRKKNNGGKKKGEDLCIRTQKRPVECGDRKKKEEGAGVKGKGKESSSALSYTPTKERLEKGISLERS